MLALYYTCLLCTIHHTWFAVYIHKKDSKKKSQDLRENLEISNRFSSKLLTLSFRPMSENQSVKVFFVYERYFFLELVDIIF